MTLTYAKVPAALRGKGVGSVLPEVGSVLP
jgi:hypothetical protein